MIAAAINVPLGRAEKKKKNQQTPVWSVEARLTKEKRQDKKTRIKTR